MAIVTHNNTALRCREYLRMQSAQTLTTNALHAITFHKPVPQLWLLPNRCIPNVDCHSNECCDADVWSRRSTIDNW